MRNRPPATADAAEEKRTSAPRLVRTPPIPLATLRDLRSELGTIYRLARCGKLAAQDLTRFAYALGCLRDMIIAEEIERRLVALEAKSNGTERI
jgi:hypothetical protein